LDGRSTRIIEIFRNDLDWALGQLGCSAVDEIGPAMVDASGMWQPGGGADTR
jgi:hypothetical protein